MKAPFDNDASDSMRRHLQFGWWSLLVFLTLGLVLEALHGFKVGGYLNVSNSTRRLMWTLAHAHGTLLSLVHVAFAFTLRLVPNWAASKRGLASACLMGASVMIPSGFFLGGVGIYKDNSGFGIVLVPVGALLLVIAVILAARAMKDLPTAVTVRDELSSEPKLFKDTDAKPGPARSKKA